MINSFVGEHYLIERELGRDQFGAVYVGRDVRYPPEIPFPVVAIRILPANLVALEGFEARFAAIAPKLQASNQVNLTRVLAYGTVKNGNDKLYYLVTQAPTSEMLGTFMQRRRQLPIDAAAAILDQLCGAVDYAHRQGLIHGNLSIWNITIKDERRVEITDFGLMQMLLPYTLPEQEKLVSWKVPVGIPEFIAPERFRGEAPTKYNDAYVIGVILYLMITGRMPFSGTYEQLLVAHSYQQPPSLGPSIRSNLELDQYFSRLLAKNPFDRFSVQDISIRFRQATGLPRTMLPIFEAHPPLPAPPPSEKDDPKKGRGGWFRR